jgi:hypothetical protein
MNGATVDLGARTFVLARAIRAIHDGSDAPERRAAFTPWERPGPRCWVLLDTGDLVPAYLRPETVRERWEAALREEEDRWHERMGFIATTARRGTFAPRLAGTT